MQLLKRAGILCLFSFFQALGAQANPLWFADRGGLHQIDLATNAISLDLPLPENAIAIPVDPSDSSAWAVTGNTVSKFSTAGGTQFQLVLQNLGKDVGTAKVAVLDTLSGNLWIAGDKQLLLLGPGGQLLASPLVPDSVQALAVDTDRSLWVLGTSTLFQYSSAAQLIAQWGLAPPLQQSKFLALDGNAGVLWLGGSKQVVKLALNQPQTTLLTIATSEVVSSMALDSLSHALWVSGAQNLFRYDPNGNLRTTTGLRPDKITQPTDLAFDFPTQSLWLGHVGGLSRFSAQGA
jgi:ligand-binding sensor domain-containing protein